MDLQALAGVFIHEREEADLAAVLCPVEDEVVGPNMVLVFRSMTKAAIA